MDDNRNAERTPLLETFEDYQKPLWCYSIGCASIFIAIILTSLLKTTAPECPTDIDISKIPYEYQLRFKNHWTYNYIIEGLPTEFNEKILTGSSVIGNDLPSLNSNNPEDDQTEFVKYGEIIVPQWIHRNINVIEFRYNPDGTIYDVLTVITRLDGYFTGKVDITFTAFNDPSAPEACEYRITWSLIFNGYIWKKCEKEDEAEFKKVSYFRGSTAWGLEFWSVDERVKYGYSTRTAFWWSLYKRDIIVDPASPFPPILPAIYTAYYDILQRRRTRNNKRKS